jgi:hypothetical protein
MFKVRDGRLHQTIANRSNDLNWGLTTNIFQFSFIGEILAAILGIQYGTQTHLSQSLHIYMNDTNSMSELTSQLQAQFIHSGHYEEFRQGKRPVKDLYALVEEMHLVFNYNSKDDTAVKKLFWVDFYLHAIIVRLLNANNGHVTMDSDEELFEGGLKEFCFGFWYIYQLLKVYLSYKQHKLHEQAVRDLVKLIGETGTSKYDISALALNFFLARLFKKDKARYYEINDWVCGLFPRYRDLPLGKL